MEKSFCKLGFAVAAAVMLAGCGQQKAAGPAAAPIVNVVSIAAKRQPVSELLSLVGLSASAAERFPAEFSGGQRQRVCMWAILLSLRAAKDVMMRVRIPSAVSIFREFVLIVSCSYCCTYNVLKKNKAIFTI